MKYEGNGLKDVQFKKVGDKGYTCICGALDGLAQRDMFSSERSLDT